MFNSVLSKIPVSFRRVKEEPEPVPPLLSKYELMVRELCRIDPPRFKRVHSSDKSGFTVDTLYRDIRSYRSGMLDAIRNLKNNTRAIKTEIKIVSESILIRDFFLSPIGAYLDETNEIERWVSEAQLFITLMEEIDRYLANPDFTDDRTFNIRQHNSRLYATLLQNIESMTTSFIEVWFN